MMQTLTSGRWYDIVDEIGEAIMGSIDPMWIPALTKVVNNEVQMTRRRKIFTEAAEKPESFSKYVESLPTVSQRMLSVIIEMLGGSKRLKTVLESKIPVDIQAATDGSLSKGEGSFGWIVLDSWKQVIFTGAGPVGSHTWYASSTRSELFEMAAILEFL